MEKKRLPVSVTFGSMRGLSPDDNVKVGDLQLTPMLPIVGLSIDIQVGEPPDMVIEVAPHDGWSVEAQDVLVKLRELVQVEPVQDMRTSPAAGSLRLLAEELGTVCGDLVIGHPARPMLASFVTRIKAIADGLS